MCRVLFWVKALFDGLSTGYRSIDNRVQCVKIPSYTVECALKKSYQSACFW